MTDIAATAARLAAIEHTIADLIQLLTGGTNDQD